MSFRGLRLATQFLTRLPVPAVEQPGADELSRAAAWFPFIGLGIGLVVVLVVLVFSHAGALLAGALGVLAWVALTGALHLDGLADLTDALAAAHRDPQRFLEVLADPHAGTFAVVSIVMVLMLKLAGLAELSRNALIAAATVPAWARLGTLVWSRWLRPLKSGRGASFGTHLSAGWIAFWTLLLLGTALCTAPVLCATPLAIAAWGAWLHRRLGGVTGDCLGAGVEVIEAALVVALAICGTTGALMR